MTGSELRDYIVNNRGFKRDDKDTQIYEAITDAVQEMRRRFMFQEAEVEKTTTAVISVLGNFKIAVESDFGLLLGIILEDNDIGTPLNKITKAKFDRKYPYINVDPNFTGYPRDFCLFANQIYVGPIPDKTTYAYRLSYSSKGGSVVSGTSSVPFSADYRDVLADNVLGRLYKDLEEFDKAQQYRGDFEGGLILAVRRERQNTGESGFTMIPRDC